MTARCVFLNRRFIYIFYHLQQGELYRAEIGAKDGVLFSNLLAVALRCFFFFFFFLRLILLWVIITFLQQLYLKKNAKLKGKRAVLVELQLTG